MNMHITNLFWSDTLQGKYLLNIILKFVIEVFSYKLSKYIFHLKNDPGII